ncbi:MAG: nicotinate-nucleotide adenylyltransferase [Gemmataceae bacterium]
MRVGIFGGTFDPVHLGHLILAEQARDYARLDQVWFLPAPRPPQKEEQAITRLDQRIEMLELAIAGHPSFHVDPRERNRPGPSYTADTLDELATAHPEHQWFLLLGGDSLNDLPRWYDPQRIVRRATLVVMTRPGTQQPTQEQLEKQLGVSVQIEIIPAPQIDIRSRDLRQRVNQGHSIRYLVPRPVEVFIQQRRLYLSATD